MSDDSIDEQANIDTPRDDQQGKSCEERATSQSDASDVESKVDTSEEQLLNEALHAEIQDDSFDADRTLRADPHEKQQVARHGTPSSDDDPAAEVPITIAGATDEVLEISDERPTDDEPIVHYEAPDGFYTCTFDDAQLWFYSGYFAMTMNFVFAPRDADVTGEEWRKWTLSDLIDRNGSEMPFLMIDDQNEEKKMEMAKAVEEDSSNLETKKQEVKASIHSMKETLRDRIADVEEEMRQIKMRKKLKFFSHQPFQSGDPQTTTPNPFAELYADDFDSMRSIILRTAVGKILSIKNYQAHPVGTIYPFHILLPFKAKTNVGEELDFVTPYAEKLSELFDEMDARRFNSLVEHLFKEKEPRCSVCNKELGKVPYDMLDHIMSEDHVERMIDRNMIYQEEALAFWMHALRIAEKCAPWFPVETREIGVNTDAVIEVPKKKGKAKAKNGSNTSSRRSSVQELTQSLHGVNLVTAPPKAKAPPKVAQVPVLPVNSLALVPSPFAEILHPHPGNPQFVTDLMNRVSNALIVRIEKKRAIPNTGIDPFAVVSTTPALIGPVEFTIMPYVNKLKELVDECDMFRFQSVVNPPELSKSDQEPFCTICDTKIMHGHKMPYLMMKHLASDAHVEQMISRNVIHLLEPLAYWMLTLRIAKKDAAWFPLADTPLMSPSSISNLPPAFPALPHAQNGSQPSVPPPHFTQNGFTPDAPPFVPHELQQDIPPNGLPNVPPPQFVRNSFHPQNMAPPFFPVFPLPTPNPYGPNNGGFMNGPMQWLPNQGYGRPPNMPFFPENGQFQPFPAQNGFGFSQQVPQRPSYQGTLIFRNN